MWVYATDEPHSQGSATDPRTEMRWLQEYSSGYNRNSGTLGLGNGTVVATAVYNRWVNLKVAHNATTRSIQVYINNQLALRTTDQGSATRHFKNGVYHHGSNRAEARFRNIRYWVR